MAQLCTALLFVVGPQDNRAWLATVEASGPSESVVVSVGSPDGGDAAEGSTSVKLALPAGERRTLAVPLAARVPAGTPRHLLHARTPVVTGAGASFVAWAEEQPQDRWSAVPPGLRARNAPPVERAPRAAGLAGAALGLGAFALAWAARRRPAVLALVTVLATLGAWWVPFPSGARALVVHEGMGASRTRVRVEARRERLRLPVLGQLLTLESRPPGPIRVTGAGEPLAWEASARGATLVARSLRPAAPLEHGHNGWRDLEHVWLRVGGDWRHLGSWSLGAPLGAAVDGPDPPGWLATGLPQGSTVLLGQLVGDARGPSEWVRITDFPGPP